MRTSKFENFDSAQKSESVKISDIFEKAEKSAVSNLREKKQDIKEDFAEVKKEIRQEENNIKKSIKEIGKSIRKNDFAEVKKEIRQEEKNVKQGIKEIGRNIKEEEHKVERKFRKIDRKKVIIFLKITGILLSLLIVGLATFYLVNDSYFWHIYLIFLVLGSVFVFLFSRNFKETEKALGSFEKKEAKKLNKLLEVIEKKQKERERKLFS